jgi:Domain of unknown function (DUF4383)
MAKTVAKILGIVFILVGIIGFFAHGLLGAHLTNAHNVIHLVSGVIALYFGFAGSLGGAKMFCIIFGIVYALLGVCGFLLGVGPDRMFDALGALGVHLGTMDHIIHILLGIIFLAGGFLTSSAATD